MSEEVRMYRGKTKDGKWVYGSLSMGGYQPYDKNATFIEPNEPVLQRIPVIPETVSQSTGLKDKNVEMAYRRDIIRITHWWHKKEWGHAVDEKTESIHIITWEHPEYRTPGWYIRDKNNELSYYDFTNDDKHYWEIIGNAIDNGDFLKG